MILVLWVLLATVPVVIGTGIMTIVYGRKEKIGFTDQFLTGFLACIGIAEVAHVVGLFGNLSLTQTGYVLLILFLVALGVTLVCGLYGYFKNKNRYVFKLEGKIAHRFVPIAFMLVLLWQVLWIYCSNPLIIAGDITLESVQSFLSHDGIYKVMPLTGMSSDTGMPMRYKILCLPTLYALLSQGVGVEPQLVVCHIIPIVVLAAAYLAYFRLSATLFGKKDLESRFVFLLMVALLFCFVEREVYLDGYGALHAGYLGTSIRNLVLVPYTISAMLEGRYVKAILCILAEACITWTFMGMGVCVVVTLGILILTILEKKLPKVGRLLQIFRKKEEQA